MQSMPSSSSSVVPPQFEQKIAHLEKKVLLLERAQAESGLTQSRAPALEPETLNLRMNNLSRCKEELNAQVASLCLAVTAANQYKRCRDILARQDHLGNHFPTNRGLIGQVAPPYKRESGGLHYHHAGMDLVVPFIH